MLLLETFPVGSFQCNCSVARLRRHQRGDRRRSGRRAPAHPRDRSPLRPDGKVDHPHARAPRSHLRDARREGGGRRHHRAAQGRPLLVRRLRHASGDVRLAGARHAARRALAHRWRVASLRQAVGGRGHPHARPHAGELLLPRRFRADGPCSSPATRCSRARSAAPICPAATFRRSNARSSRSSTRSTPTPRHPRPRTAHHRR